MAVRSAGSDWSRNNEVIFRDYLGKSPLDAGQVARLGCGFVLVRTQ
jgi:hypothetical protein